MVYVIIGLALLFIIVPIVSVLPSARQREQMAMRNAARSAGVLVELTSIEDPNPKQDKYISATGRPIEPNLKLAAYRKQRKRQPDWRKLPRVNWCLQRKFDEGWVWRGNISEYLAAEYKEWLEKAVEGLPEDVQQVEESEHRVSVYWHERGPGNEEKVLQFLSDCVSRELYDPVLFEDEEDQT